ncbi:MAG TPA: asparagine synthase (glutamine-hydrolyzing) [Gemmatimonadaceae bacterium]|nr:asparagine synthase (glutamine-hydrolyzing) [Gemmatimonadaceae bacterium]
MCGIAGYVLAKPTAETGLCISLLEGVRERGPDDEGVLLVHRANAAIHLAATSRSVASARHRDVHLSAATNVTHDVAIAHARYAVIDLSEAAHQPFSSRDGSIIAVLNGEIYNHVELRAALASEGIACRTASDTEVLVEGFRYWGADLWQRLNGFWSVVLYDARDGSVVISRDRLGVAPLYYRETEAGFFFASRIRPLLAVEPSDHTVDDVAVRCFIEAGIKDHGTDTFYSAVKCFPAATTITLARGDSRLQGTSRNRYWQLPRQRMGKSEISLADAARGMHERLVRAVELRLRSDVRVAFELSGGLDSSSVVAAAAELGHRPRTYTIHVPERDELPWAKAVVEHFGLENTVLTASEGAFGDEAQRFARIMEEPYHSPNVYTSYAMRRAMKARGEAVVISGSGGDELLAGYEHEFWDAARKALWEEGARWHVVRHAIAHTAGSRARLRHSVREAIGATKRGARAAAGLGSRGVEQPDAFTGPASRQAYRNASFDERVRFHFEVAQLPYYLRNGDHLTMSLPLEHRFPFLDWELVEFGARLPVAYLYRDGWTKYVLRRAMRGILPDSVVWRRDKMGFPFPFARFFTGHEMSLRPRAIRAMNAGYGGTDAFDYTAMALGDPLRLWRLCSTGFWLEAS